MKAVFDESSPETSGGILYIVTGVVTIADEEEAKAALDQVLVHPRRTRPFHWVNEGTDVRGRMLDCLVDIGAAAHVTVHFPTSRSGIETARARRLGDLVEKVLVEGATELIIKSRTEAMDGATVR